MKTISRFLSILLIFPLLLGCSACASQTGTPAGEESSVQAGTTAGAAQSAQVDANGGLFLSLSEAESKSLAFPLTKDHAGQVEKAGADKVTWTLHRKAPYANPADGKFIPLHGENKMFPNEKETIDFASITYETVNDGNVPFSMESFETTLDGDTLKLDFTTAPSMTYGVMASSACLTKAAAHIWTSAGSSP